MGTGRPDGIQRRAGPCGMADRAVKVRETPYVRPLLTRIPYRRDRP
ncbi:hypothetical protein SCATT_p02370 (plasmid) [Streptantibioticus cattleyicolor NRRL 8057 = DSM 46488]|uniref:Uncharacterized protein n=1 Tax=Streptantibioticus cattleyicolor (strain ATCC 35852 / DSM 46488 / JCM 4925 / NBRC 14057 / NRRL 8057) TaxID=1003195 RepID=G8XEX9_STREN|nr:hypothetical protein SCATT_p02370 [Streptantibioticus cattleyicolor NRRL 8057 = DSM 46488]